MLSLKSSLQLTKAKGILYSEEFCESTSLHTEFVGAPLGSSCLVPSANENKESPSILMIKENEIRRFQKCRAPVNKPDIGNLLIKGENLLLMATNYCLDNEFVQAHDKRDK